jgi:anti-sigma B factor antagonist
MQYELEEKDGYSMIHVIGNVDTEGKAANLDRQISKIMKTGCHDFVFNLERTTFLNSAGIGIFIHCLCDIKENNGSLFIIAHDPKVREVLTMTGVDRLIKTYYSERDMVREMKLAIV